MGTIVYRKLRDFKQHSRLTEIDFVTGIDPNSSAARRGNVDQASVVNDAGSVCASIVEEAILACRRLKLDVGVGARDRRIRFVGRFQKSYIVAANRTTTIIEDF